MGIRAGYGSAGETSRTVCPFGSGSAWELIRKGGVNLSEVGRLHKATNRAAMG
jgi:hypothetical protein